MAEKIAVNAFAERQTAESKYSHFAGSWDGLLRLVESNFVNAKPGYRDGVVKVEVPAVGFFTGVTEVTGNTELKAVYEDRRRGEMPYIQVVAVGATKIPAAFVEVILYRHDVLGNDASTSDADREIVSINARPTLEEEPMTPMTMARNFLELPGGTKAEYTAEQFAEAIIYWSNHAMCG